MICATIHCFRLLFLLLSGHRAVALENLALRQQLAIYKRQTNHPKLTGRDRWFWIVLCRFWKGWRRALEVVHPDKVLRWHRQRFRKYWAELSNRHDKPGRSLTDCRDSATDSSHGHRKRTVAWAAHSRRVAQTRNYGFRTDCFAIPSYRRTSSFANLEDLFEKPRRRTCLDRFFHGADRYTESPVRLRSF